MVESMHRDHHEYYGCLYGNGLVDSVVVCMSWIAQRVRWCRVDRFCKIWLARCVSAFVWANSTIWIAKRAISLSVKQSHAWPRQPLGVYNMENVTLEEYNIAYAPFRSKESGVCNIEVYRTGRCSCDSRMIKSICFYITSVDEKCDLQDIVVYCLLTFRTCMSEFLHSWCDTHISCRCIRAAGNDVTYSVSKCPVCYLFIAPNEPRSYNWALMEFLKV
jgi:hypothetical protein